MADRGLCALAESIVALLAGFEPAVHSIDECIIVVETLARLQNACAAAQARTAARVATCDGQRSRGFVRATDWLATTSGTSTVDAERALAVADRITELTDTGAALAAGELSLAQAHEVLATVEACGPAAEAELVDVARTSSLRTLRDEGRARRLAAVDVEDLRRRQRAARFHRHWRDDDGMIRNSGAMLPEHGVAFMHRVDVETDRAYRRAHRAGEVEPRERLAADGFAAVVAGGATAHPTRADVVYVCDVATGASHIVGGGPVPPSVVRDRVRAGAFVKAVLHDGTTVETIAHYGRHIPAALRTVLEPGDPSAFDGVECAEPGCQRRHGLEWDHVDPVANGGPTTHDNLAPRCHECHTDKTERDRLAGLLTGAGRHQAPPGPAP